MADRPSLHARRARDPNRFPVADHELTEQEIEVLYGAFIAAGLQAFDADVSYLIAMYEGAERVERARPANKRAVATRRARGH